MRSSQSLLLLFVMLNTSILATAQAGPRQLRVTPSDQLIAPSATQQYTAALAFFKGVGKPGGERVVTTAVTWSSSNPSAATIGLHTGLVTAGSTPGTTTTITAVSGVLRVSVQLTVSTATLNSITVTPADPSVPLGRLVQFTATGNYSNGTHHNLTDAATWSSGTTTTATINSSSGLATTKAQGSTLISATLGSTTGTSTLSVTAPVLDLIQVTPANGTVILPATQQFTATGIFSDSSTQDLTTSATWSSSSAGVATIGANTGLATAAGPGTTTISASFNAVTGSTSFTVIALTSIAISPSNPRVVFGSKLQFTATGTYSDGSTQNLTTSATWSSSKTGVATIGANTGLATTAGPGTTTISATFNAVTGSTSFTVIALTSIAISPSNPSIVFGSKLQLTATGTYSDGSTRDFTATAAWSSSNLGVATVNATGLVTSVHEGTTTIQAIQSGVTGSTQLSVVDDVAISISPSSTSLTVNSIQQFTVTVTGASNTSVTWSVNGVVGGNSTLGTISTSGLYTAPASVPNPAAVTVTATSVAQTSRFANAAVTITPAPGKVLIGYFPEWGPGGGYYAKNVITSGSAPLLTVLNYAFANVTNNTCALADPYSDYQQTYNSSNSVDGSTDGTSIGLYGSFHQLQELKAKYPNLKVVISLGGGTLSGGFSAAAQPANVSGFVSSCIDLFINGNIAPGVSAAGLFDGIDIDWEWPTSSDTSNYVNMIALFRSKLDATRPGLMLTVAGSPGRYAYVPQNLAAIYPYLNYINIEAYDYDGPWNSVTNFVAPLYTASGSPTAGLDIDSTLQGYLATGVPASKLTLGVPFYAYDWTGVPNVNNGLYQTGTPDQNGGTYAHIVQIMGSYQQFRDPVSQEPWLFNGSTYWTYDDPTSIAFKMSYLKTKGLAGAMFWELAQDTPNGTLIQAVHNGLQ